MDRGSLVHDVLNSADFSPDRTCRLSLRRVWDKPKGILLFIGLNPSTANATEDDPTIRRLLGFSRSWGLGGLVACNLYTRITPYPDELPVKAPLQDDDVLLEQAAGASLILAAWGAFRRARDRGKYVARMLTEAGHSLHCLGTNADGSPKHPLYIPSSRKPIPYGG